MFCPNCGKPLNEDAKFCTECGTQIRPPQKETEPSAPIGVSPPLSDSVAANKHAVKPILLILPAVIIVLLIIGFLHWNTDKDAADDLAVQEDGTLSESESHENDISVYAEVIAKLHEKYGTGSYSEYGEPQGLVLVREIDLDQDGNSELFCAFANPNMRTEDWPDGSEYEPKCNGMNCLYCYEIWGTRNEVPVQIYHGPVLFDDVSSFRFDFVRLNDQIYYRNFCAPGANRCTRYWTLQSGEWVQCKVLFTFDFINFMIDGNVATAEEYEKESQLWNDAQEYLSYAFFDGQDELIKTKEVLQEMGVKVTTDPTQKMEFVNLMEYTGDWYVQSINRAVFSISFEDGTYYVSGSASYSDGDYQVTIAPVPLSLSGNIASAEYYEDNRGHHGTIQLEIQRDVLYATVTAISEGRSDWWDMAMENELCTQTAPYFEGEVSDSSDDYWLDSQYIDESSLSEVTREDIMWARNEIYARHGYIFQNKKIQAAFEATDWYVPNPNYSDSLLNDIENENLNTLIAYEKKMGWRS